jgi:hypothetical protein
MRLRDVAAFTSVSEMTIRRAIAANPEHFIIASAADAQTRWPIPSKDKVHFAHRTSLWGTDGQQSYCSLIGNFQGRKAMSFTANFAYNRGEAEEGSSKLGARVEDEGLRAVVACLARVEQHCATDPMRR